MEQKITSLLATFKTADVFGTKYIADFPGTSIGGQQFALIHAALPQTATYGASQVSGGESSHGAVLAKVAGRHHLHDDMIAITNAAHALALLGNPIAGKFLMHSTGDQALLNSARAFAADAVPFTVQFVSVGLPATFTATLNADITAFESHQRERGRHRPASGGRPVAWKTPSTKPALPCMCWAPSLKILTKIILRASPNGPAPAASKNMHPSIVHP
jgi:hypothetical protein